MLYNLLESAAVNANTEIGDIVLSYSDVVGFYDETIPFTVSSGSTLCVDCDLGDRICLESIEYLFNSSASSEIVSSDINFYYKEQAYDSYTLLDTTYSGSVYSPTLSGIFAPRFIRLKHNITTYSGEVNYFKVFNEDEYVDFGSDGSLTQDEIATSLDSDPFIKSIEIYNDSYGVSANAKVILEPQGTYIDDCMTISTSSEGPWSGPKDQDNVIAVFSTADGGTYDGVEVIDSKLYIEGENYSNSYASATSSGVYISKIFFAEKTLSHINIDNVKNLTGTNISNNENDSIETIEIRSTDTKPEDASFIRTLFVENERARYKDIWKKDGSTKYTQPETEPLLQGVTGLYNSFITVDPNTNTTVFIINWQQSNWNNIDLIIMDNEGSTTSKNLMSQPSSTFTAEFYDISLDSGGGFWIYFYCSSKRSDKFIDNDGYYLVHFDSSLNDTFKYNSRDSFSSGSLAVNYEDKSTWYIDIVNGRVLKLNTAGDTLVANYDEKDNMKYIVSDGDNGCWYLDNTSLYRLNYYGIEEEALEDIFSEDVSVFAIANSESFWVIEDSYIRRINKSGETLVSIHTTSPFSLEPVDSGVWIYCADSYVRFLSISSNKMELEYEYLEYESVPGAIEFDYNNIFYSNLFPISIDDTWLNLEWKEVSLRKYYLPENKYHQIRFTLRSNKPSDIYEVASDRVWNTEDSFVDNILVPYIWQTDLATNRVEVVSGTCQLKSLPSSSIDSYINTYNKWYTVNDEFNLQIRYEFPDGHPTSDTSIYMTLWALDEGHEGEYYRMEIKRFAANNDLYIAAHYYATQEGSSSTHTDYDATTWPSYNYEFGYLRMVMPTLIGSRGFDVYNYNEDTSLWQGFNQSLTNGYDKYNAGARFYVEISASAGGVDVHLTDFVVNNSYNNIYMYKYSPEIRGMYVHDYVNINDIPLNASKPIYLKTSTPSTTNSEAGSYNTNLRVWWELQE